MFVSASENEVYMVPSVDELCRDEWVTPCVPEIRMRFRKDGTGYYDRKEPGRLVHEKLLYELGASLRLKLAHARGWIEVAATVRPGPALQGDRFAERELILSQDPYRRAVEDRPCDELVLQSDAGASLPSS